MGGGDQEQVLLQGWGIARIRCCFFFFQAEDGIRDTSVTGVQTCALPIWRKALAQEDHLQSARDAYEPGQPDRPAPGGQDAKPQFRQTHTDAALIRYDPVPRSEERRVGKECRARCARGAYKGNGSECT